MPAITHMAAVRREIISMSVESFTPTALLEAARIRYGRRLFRVSVRFYLR